MPEYECCRADEFKSEIIVEGQDVISLFDGWLCRIKLRPVAVCRFAFMVGAVGIYSGLYLTLGGHPSEVGTWPWWLALLHVGLQWGSIGTKHPKATNAKEFVSKSAIKTKRKPPRTLG